MELMTPAEWLEQGMPENHTIWTHGLDLVKHCLQGDPNQTFLKDQKPARDHFNEWQTGMEQRTEPSDDFDEIMDNAYKPVKKWQAYSWDSGDLQVDAFISGEELPFDAWEKRLAQQPAISIILDTFIPYMDRSARYMQEWHTEIYNIVAKCESEQRPCRVVSVYGSRSAYDGLPESNPLKLFSIIKDYDDPIFPAIWGTYVNNRYANAFVNVVADYFLGLHSVVNGCYSKIPDLRSYFPEDEEIIFFSKRSTLD